MIVFREKFYFASLRSDLENEIISPTRPNNELAKKLVGDYKTERTCFYPTISQAISSLGKGLVGKTVYIYSTTRPRPEYTYKPDIQESPFKDITGEIWVTSETKLLLVGIYKINRQIKLSVHSYYNPRRVDLEYPTYSFSEIIKGKMTKAVILDNPNKSQVKVNIGTKIFRSIADAAKEKTPGQIFGVYRPSSGTKILATDDLRSCESYSFIKVGKVEITEDRNYKTL